MRGNLELEITSKVKCMFLACKLELGDENGTFFPAMFSDSPTTRDFRLTFHSREYEPLLPSLAYQAGGGT